MSKIFYTTVWKLSEWTNIPLGRFAPYVFHQMLGGTNPIKRVQS